MNESVLDPSRWSARWADLPEPARARLRRAIAGSGDLAPLHVDALVHVGERSVRPEAVAVTAAGALVAIASVRLGDACHPREGLGLTAAVAGLAYVAAAAVLVARERRRSRTGIAPGRYVFPTDLVAIDDHAIHVTPLAAVRSAERGGVEGTTMTLRLEGGAVEVLVVPDERARAAIRDAIRAVRDAVETGDRAAVFDRDVLAATRGGGAESATVEGAGPYRSAPRRAPARVRAHGRTSRIALLALPALALGVGLALARNELGDALAAAALRDRLAAVEGPRDLARADLLHDARCYVAREDARDRDGVRRDVVAPLALAVARERGDEEGWRTLLREISSGPEAESARIALEGIERVRLARFTRPDLSADQARALEALGRAAVHDQAPLVVEAWSRDRVEDAVAEPFREALAAELRWQTRGSGLVIELADRVPSGASEGPRLVVRYSLVALPDRWIDEEGELADGAEAHAEVSLEVADVTWSTEVVAQDPAPAGATSHATAPRAEARRPDRASANGAAQALARAIATVVLPPRP